MSEAAGRIGSLEAILKSASGTGLPPVERWNPPYCGDVGLRIRADGVWLYQGSPIGRAALVRLFSTVLRRDEDGRHYLVTPAEKVDVMVEDAPFLAVEVEVTGEGPSQTLIFRTNVDDVVAAGPEHPLRFEVQPSSQGAKPYVLVRGRLWALAARSVYYELAELAVPRQEGGRDALGLWSSGCFFELPQVSQD